MKNLTASTITMGNKKRKRKSQGNNITPKASLSVILTQVALYDDFIGKRVKPAPKNSSSKNNDCERKPPKQTVIMPGPRINIIRHSSAKKGFKDHKNQKKKHLKMAKQRRKSNDDDTCNPYIGTVSDKYWAQRKRLFQKFDQGIKLDTESWYSVTPEAIALHTANRIASMKDDKDGDGGRFVVLDAFCGCGGNAIAFGNHPDISFVVCVDSDIFKLKMAAHNASVYNVPTEKMLFVHADAVEVMRDFYHDGKKAVPPAETSNDATKVHEVELCSGYTIGHHSLLPDEIDAVFISPPWGGEEYLSLPQNGFDLLSHIQICSNIVTTEPQCNERNASNNANQKNDTEDEEKVEDKADQKSDVTTEPQCTERDEKKNPDEKNENEEKIDDKAEQITEQNSVDGVELLKLASQATSTKIVIYFLPRNLSAVSLGRTALRAQYNKPIEMEEHMLNGKVKTISAYFGFNSKALLQPPPSAVPGKRQDHVADKDCRQAVATDEAKPVACDSVNDNKPNGENVTLMAPESKKRKIDFGKAANAADAEDSDDSNPFRPPPT